MDSGGDESDNRLEQRVGEHERGQQSPALCFVELELLSDERPLVVLSQDEFVLQADEQFTQKLRIRLPEDLTYGVYGLALVVPDTFSVISSLSVGVDVDDSLGSWPAPNCW